MSQIKLTSFTEKKISLSDLVDKKEKDTIYDEKSETYDISDEEIEIESIQIETQQSIDNVSMDLDEKLSNLHVNFDVIEEAKKDSEEEILSDIKQRLTIKPIDPKYEVLFKLYKFQRDALWHPEEIDFAEDANDFEALPKDIQTFIEAILAFFAASDTIVNINIEENFSRITIMEAKICYAYQTFMENIHGEVYADQLLNIVRDEKKRNKLLNAFKNVKSIKKMIDWAKQWIECKRRIGFSIVAFAIMEGVFFSGAFAGIYWLKKILNGKMKGFIQSNNLIAKDEGMHVNFGALMYDYVVHRLTKEEFETMLIEAVDIAKSFMDDALPVKLIGMNSEIMGEYVEYVSDRLAVILGYEKVFNTKLPDALGFMDSIGFLNKDNFFERRPTEYQKAINSDNNATDYEFKILEDF